ncbi:MAG TPA: chromate resistance protein ChrB domain-containing protein [Thermodesulfovibrionales bacterium]|nr:chromate resistance protein ChrB domain-containing protein [Thermodesulfovibrionales bacterium]
MKPAPQKSAGGPPGWLLFFYSVPSKPVSNRMKVWRKLLKAGAVQLKGSVYILPFNDERYEFLQWLVSEIAAMKGEGAFARIEHIDSIKDSEIIALFDQQRANDYKAIEKSLDDLERVLGSIKQGGKAHNMKALSDQFSRLLKEFEEVRGLDFFSSKAGEALNRRIQRDHAELNKMSAAGTKKESVVIVSHREVDAYRGKAWVTRKRPFIDRMASAWLIRRFIDRDASFAFVDERDVNAVRKDSVVFDMRGGEFTHVGDLCTFEVLVRSFGFKDRTLKKMAEIVHDLDTKDDKYGSAEARGLEDILTGIRKTAKDDLDALEKGMQVFEMLYISKS